VPGIASKEVYHRRRSVLPRESNQARFPRRERVVERFGEGFSVDRTMRDEVIVAEKRSKILCHTPGLPIDDGFFPYPRSALGARRQRAA
jgi:hypothetical protein